MGSDTGPCVPAGVAYRYVIKNLGGLNGWAAYVLRNSDGTQVWGAPHDPIGLGFTIDDAEYSTEVINEADQAGGGSSSRGYLDSPKWYDSYMNPVNANIPSADRFCQRCNPSTDGYPVGPYNTDWSSGLVSPSNRYTLSISKSSGDKTVFVGRQIILSSCTLKSNT